MLPHIPDRAVRGERAAVRRRFGARLAGAGLAAVLVLLAFGSALPGQRITTRASAQDTARSRESAPPGDLRCLTRRAEDCLTAPVPADEPHGAVCATCHKLWERETAAGTIKSCTASGCHERPETLTSFHETLSAATLEDCTGCHVEHSFRVPDRRADCSVCHTAGGRAAIQAHTAPARRLPAELPFTHTRHVDLSCVSCHSARTTHGMVNVADFADCQSCHHGSAVSRDCVRCHQPEETAALSFPVTRTLDIRIGSVQRPSRTLRFEHAEHSAVACTQCHTGQDFAVPASSDCSSCHYEHHEPSADCSGCHERPAEGAHDRNSHLGCGGAACHERVPAAIEWAPRTRALCLACHTDQREHMPGRDCAGCHALPPAGPAKNQPPGTRGSDTTAMPSSRRSTTTTS